MSSDTLFFFMTFWSVVLLPVEPAGSSLKSFSWRAFLFLAIWLDSSRTWAAPVTPSFSRVALSLQNLKVRRVSTMKPGQTYMLGWRYPSM